MTIGIVARGPGAGRAAWDILRAAEALGTGSIAGFAVFRWAFPDGRHGLVSCQDGGTLGLGPQGDWAEASHAAIISSGPNRPEPLTQFVAFSPSAGFVSGHRLPTSPLPDGTPINLAALDGMAAGGMDDARLASLLGQGPGMDAGLLCLPWTGPLAMADSQRVETRGDTGSFRFEEGELVCALLHNSIHTATLHGQDLARALGGIGRAVLTGQPQGHQLAALPDRLAVTPASFEALELDPQGRVIALHSADPAYFSARPRITAVYQGVPILRNGQIIGRAVSEVFVALDRGCLVAGLRRDFVWVSL